MQTVLGDVSKWVPMSSDRFLELQVTQTDATVILNGTVKETVSVYFLADNEVRQTDCDLISPNCVLSINRDTKKGIKQKIRQF